MDEKWLSLQSSMWNVRRFISEIRDISAKLTIYQRNSKYISEIKKIPNSTKHSIQNKKSPINCLKIKNYDDTNTNQKWGGISMIQVKVFDYEHEKDLEKDMNYFLSKLEDKKIVDIKYHVAALSEEVEDQIYCFSAMVVYTK
jgi:hypothetical protein